MLTNVKKKSKLVNEERLEVTLEEKKKKRLSQDLKAGLC